MPKQTRWLTKRTLDQGYDNITRGMEQVIQIQELFKGHSSGYDKTLQTALEAIEIGRPIIKQVRDAI